jgi:hypothetical protein
MSLNRASIRSSASARNSRSSWSSITRDYRRLRGRAGKIRAGKRGREVKNLHRRDA